MADEQDEASSLELIEKAELERRAEYEGWLVRKGGERFWASVVLSAVTDAQGRVLGYSDVTVDLTDHERTTRSLRRSEEHFRRLVDSLEDYALFGASRASPGT